MKVTYRTEDEIDMANLLAPGIYTAEVVKAEETTSKNGNEMMTLDLHVHVNGGGSDRIIRDYLLDLESMAYKLRHFCECADLLVAYKTGSLEAQHLVGKTVHVRLEVEKQKEYRPKNVVRDYVTQDKIENGTKAGSDEKADDLPFSEAR